MCQCVLCFKIWQLLHWQVRVLRIQLSLDTRHATFQLLMLGCWLDGCDEGEIYRSYHVRLCSIGCGFTNACKQYMLYLSGRTDILGRVLIENNILWMIISTLYCCRQNVHYICCRHQLPAVCVWFIVVVLCRKVCHSILPNPCVWVALLSTLPVLLVFPLQIVMYHHNMGVQ
jgi:hypothetical protein